MFTNQISCKINILSITVAMDDPVKGPRETSKSFSYMKFCHNPVKAPIHLLICLD